MSLKMSYDSIAAGYARYRRAHPEVLKSLCAAIGPASTVLEVGCGTGNYVVAIQDIVGCMCWGLDPSAGMLAQARVRSEAVTWQQSSAEVLDVPEQIFDLVFSVDVIHHVQDRPAYVGKAYRALKPGGRLCTATDSEWVIRNRVPLAAYFPETIEAEMARYPRIADLRRWMEQVGFEDVAEETVEYAYELSDIQAYREKTFSALHLISGEAFQRGMARMEADLERGPIPCVSRYTLVWGKKGE